MFDIYFTNYAIFMKINDFDVSPFNVTFEPLAGSTFTNFIKLLVQNRFKVDPVGIPRLLYSTLMCTVQSPLNIIEKHFYNKNIQDLKFVKPPLFIIGHWRTGSTYLHNLLSLDNNFAFPTTLQTVIPGSFVKFTKLMYPIVAGSLPETRPQDDVALGAELPNEEEYAMGNLSRFSFYHGWCFPKNMDKYNDYIDFKDVPQSEIDEFIEIYLEFLKKVAYVNDNKMLLIKNPSNTARIKLLLELFPDAKFIHMIRNPFHVFLSMQRNVEKEMPLYTLQNPPKWEVFEHAIVDVYKRMYAKYFKEKELIPPGNHADVRYENLIKRPMQELEQLYHNLELNDFANTKTKFKAYIASQKDIRLFKYDIDAPTKQKIYSYLKDNIDLWEYNM